MDYRTFSKPKMWASVAGGIICYIMFAYELFARLMNDSQFVKAECRQSIIINIFSNATAVLCLLVFLIHHITIKGSSVAVDAFLGICAICFSVILVQSIQNLKRFDS
ncbi:MAG: hypothetical protein IKH49_10075 [Bacteroidales bacterium]|nr:hypothetical protein [Bacteroidales bacterium]